jgi:anaerobic ribonucleoside-triphosphate reductase
MNISRPTFTRLIEKARNHLAIAIIEGHELVLCGGNVEFEQTIRHCKRCGEEEKVPVRDEKTNCPGCGSNDVEDLARELTVETHRQQDS